MFKPGGSLTICLMILLIYLCFSISRACCFFFSSFDGTKQIDFPLLLGSSFKVGGTEIELEPTTPLFIEIPFVSALVVVVVVVEVMVNDMGSEIGI